jgi:hypothetical protein
VNDVDDGVQDTGTVVSYWLDAVGNVAVAAAELVAAYVRSDVLLKVIGDWSCTITLNDSNAGFP